MDLRLLFRNVAPLAALATLALASAQPELPPAPGQLVDVGGRNLHVYCVGDGSPTVVLEAGLGDGSINFRALQTRIAAFTRVCAYDRAGYGWSDEAEDARDLEAIVADLHALLEGAGEEGPYVLAGHSLGGLIALGYAKARPGDVVGVVLIDSSHPHQMDRLAAVPELVTAQELEIEGLAAAIDMAESGGLPPDAVRPNAPPVLAPALQDEWARLFVQPKQLRAAVAEFRALDATLAQAAAALDLGDLPVTVVSRGVGVEGQLPAEALEALGLTPDVLRRAEEIWSGLQQDLLNVSTSSKRVVAERSPHYVYYQQPALVVAAVRELVTRAR
ncbi:MAG TPA: alpha/beta hydrolase [Trueperaceae bacterium]|nr:alpha/beta hydrolase [Trueperaceae bacterium]